MAIDKMKLFETARERWPISLRVAPSDGIPPFHSDPSLAEVYRAIEASCAPTGEVTPADEWTQLANWAFHQALCELASEGDAEGHVRRLDLTFEMFDHWMRCNLSDEAWTAEREEYDASPLRFS